VKGDDLTRDTCLNDLLADEDMEVIKNVQVRQEILDASNSEIDIGVAGAYTARDLAEYESIYNSLQSGESDLKTARDRIGDNFR